MADYEKVDGPIPKKELEVSEVLCPGCKKENLVIKVRTTSGGRDETQHLLCLKCNYADQRLVDKKTGEVLLDRSKTL